MIRKNKSLTSQLREMKIGQSVTISARSGVTIDTLKGTVGRLKKEGGWYRLSVAGLPKGACTITRIEPGPEIPQRTNHQIKVVKVCYDNQVQSTKSRQTATILEVDYTQAGEPKHTALPLIYDQYEYWQRRLREKGELSANAYIAKLIEDTLQ